MAVKVPGGCHFLIRKVGEDDIFSPELFTDEQRMFAASAEDFIEREVRPDIERLEQHEPGLMVKKLKRAGELGLLMIDIPEEYGGLELDLTTSMLCSEKLATYASFSVTHGAHAGIGTLPTLFFGTDEQRQKYLPKLATGEIIGAYALTEPSSGSDAMNASTRAELVTGPDGKEYWKLNGTKMWITNGAWADLITVFAKVDGQAFSAFLVEAPSEGLEAGAEENKMGIKGSSTTEIVLDDVLVPKENLLGDIGKGHKIAFNVLNVGRFKLGVGALGGAKRLMEVTVKYAKERIAFGQPISDFGAIRRKFAQMAIRTFALESMCYRVGGYMVQTIEEIDRDDPDYTAKVMAAIEEYSVEDSIMKVFGSELSDFVCDECVQIHGGYGFHHDYEVERAYRDSRVNRIFEGTNEINRLLVPGTMLKRTMKGQLPLFGKIQEVNASIELEKPTPPALDAPDLGWERFFVEEAKRAAIYTANATVQKYMTNIKDQQELLLDLADQLAWIYALDSTFARVQRWPTDAKRAILRALVAEGYEQVLMLGRRVVTALGKPKQAAKHLNALEHMTHHVEANVLDAERAVADVMIEREKWPFGAA